MTCNSAVCGQERDNEDIMWTNDEPLRFRLQQVGNTCCHLLSPAEVRQNVDYHKYPK